MQKSGARCAADVQQPNGLDDALDIVWARVQHRLGIEWLDPCALCGVRDDSPNEDCVSLLNEDGLCPECDRAHNAETLRP